jgi:hypothetical protein
MPETALTEEKILREYPRLGPDDRFTFRCDPGVDCFTACCANVSIVLAPYDVLRLKRALRLDSSEFLERFTISPFTKDQKVPAVLLKMDPETKRCPFVTERGCGVYAHRPWACRMYPLGSAEPRNPTPTERGFHFLLREPLCHGHDQGPTRTVREWILEQGLEEYEALGGPFRDLMLHEFWDRAEPLEPRKMEMYFMACYDLDRFRRFVFETRFLELFEVDEARVEALRSDDEALLEFAAQWLRFSLFGERSMKLKRSVIEARRRAAQEAAQQA